MKKLMDVILTGLLLLLLSFATGCQSDLTITTSNRLLYKGENENNEYLSRGTGPNFTTGWSIGNTELGDK